MNRWIVYSITLLALSSVTVLAACNTFEGVGQDLQSGGRSIERAADDSK